MRGPCQREIRRTLGRRLGPRFCRDLKMQPVRSEESHGRVHGSIFRQRDPRMRRVDLRSIGEHDSERGELILLRMGSFTVTAGRMIHDFPLFFSVEQWGLTCDSNRWKLTLVGTINNVGQFVGLIFAGYVSDR